MSRTIDWESLEPHVVAAMRGDDRAYAQVVERCAGVVTSIALAIVRNVEASEDIAQEVFLSVWTGLRKLRNAASFLPWLRQIARNQAHTWLREHRRETLDDELLQRAVDIRPRVDEELTREEERRIVTEVIAELPDDAREVVILFYREASSVRHVAELLGISDDAVRQRLTRARNAIREEVLRRFSTAVVRTAPGAAFVAAVLAGLSTVAPAAGAATTLAAASKISGWPKLLLLLQGSALGALGGLAGIMIAVRRAEKLAIDDEELAGIRRYRNISFALVLFVVAGFAASSYLRPTWAWAVGTYLIFIAGIANLTFFQMPAVISRRLALERATDPHAAARQRRNRILCALGFALGAILGSAGLLIGLMR